MAITPAEIPNTLVTRESVNETPVGAILPHNILEVVTLAKTLFVSKLFPDLQNAEQAVAKIIAGAELGLPPIASLNAFHIVKGKIMLHYSTILGGVRRAGYDYRCTENTVDACTIVFYRQGEEVGTSRFTKEDAKRSGTQNMEKLPDTMLFARAASQGARKFVPEAFNGLIVYERFEQDLIEEDAAEEAKIGTSSILATKVSSEQVPEGFNPFEEEERIVEEDGVIQGELV